MMMILQVCFSWGILVGGAVSLAVSVLLGALSRCSARARSETPIPAGIQ
eukprot:SAG31_NODE_31480_length_367_cov_1.723881_1_plen_48_part_10